MSKIIAYFLNGFVDVSRIRHLLVSGSSHGLVFLMQIKIYYSLIKLECLRAGIYGGGYGTDCRHCYFQSLFIPRRQNCP